MNRLIRSSASRSNKAELQVLIKVAVSYEAQLGKLTRFLATFSSLQDTGLKTCFFLAVDWKQPSASCVVVFSIGSTKCGSL